MHFDKVNALCPKQQTKHQQCDSRRAGLGKWVLRTWQVHYFLDELSRWHAVQGSQTSLSIHIIQEAC